MGRKLSEMTWNPSHLGLLGLAAIKVDAHPPKQKTVILKH